MSFGVIGRLFAAFSLWAPCQNWIDNIFPFLPHDFDNQYFQAAPPDQQLPYLQGGEDVALGNLAPQSNIRFKLPRIDMPIVFFYKKGGKHKTSGVIDTLIIEPDAGFLMCWRQIAVETQHVRDAQVLVANVAGVVAGGMAKPIIRRRVVKASGVKPRGNRMSTQALTVYGTGLVCGVGLNAAAACRDSCRHQQLPGNAFHGCRR